MPNTSLERTRERQNAKPIVGARAAQLNRSEGEARLAAEMPEELEIILKPADALGHIRVSGRTGFHVQANHTADWHEVRFALQAPRETHAPERRRWAAGGTSDEL